MEGNIGKGVSENLFTIQHRYPGNFEPPVPPVGKMVTKFDKGITFISAPKPDEMPNKAGFTQTQAKELMELQRARDTGTLVRRPTHFFDITFVELPQA